MPVALEVFNGGKGLVRRMSAHLTAEKLTKSVREFVASVEDVKQVRYSIVDNGVPFASPHSLFGLSRLSMWWLRPGIQVERIQPGHPEQNGRHERIHLTLKKEATQPAAQNFLQQQAKFDAFLEEYNQARPQQALGMKFPAELYTPSTRRYHGLEELDYPFHDKTVTVTQCGQICLQRHKIHLSTVFAGQNVGIKEVADKIWLISFMHYDLGFFDHETCRLGAAQNPFGAKVLSMSPV